MAVKFKPMSFWTILLVVVPTIFIASVAYAVLSNDGKDNAYVVRVVDGDTLDVKLRGKETRVRLLNVDTPETKHPEKTVQCMGPEATEFLENRLPAGTRVELEYDEEREDPYGRTLAGVYHEDSLINSEIAARGLGVAVVFKPNEKFYQQVKTAEDEAREKSEGLFDPTLGCSLPSQVEKLQKHTSTVTDAVPEDLSEFPAAFEELSELEKTVVDLSALIEQAALNTTSETSFLAVAFADEITGFKDQLKEQQRSLESHASTLEAHQQQLKEEEQRKEEEEEQQRKEE